LLRKQEVRLINYHRVLIPEDVVYVHPIGDTHIGHRNCDLAYLKTVLSAIPFAPNHRILLMGDLIDVGIKSSIGASVYENDSDTTNQAEQIIDLLRPHAKQIDGMVAGNHELRLFKEVGMDISRMISRELQIPYMKYSGVVTYSLGKRSYDLNFFHGKSGGSVENSLRKAKEMSSKVVADVYLMGHCHNKAYTTRQLKRVDARNGKVNEDTQYFVLTGHCLNYDDSYADQMNLEISTKGFPVIALHRDKKQKRIEVR
jgi:hypothetical protein